MTHRTIYEPLVLNMREVYLEAAKELLTPYPALQLPSWPQWTEAVGGFRPREFSILCGATGSGKTTFLANMSAQLLTQGVKHFVMSVETGHTDFMKRIMSALEGRDMNTGEAVNPDWLARVHTRHAQHLESDVIEFSLYEDRIPVEQLRHDLVQMSAKGCKVAFIDNLNFFMEVTSAANSVIEMDRVIHELVILAKQIDMHIVMVMHPKKTDHGRVESEFDIKGSSTAVQEAHNVFLFNRPKDPLSNPFLRELKIAKMRRRGGYAGRSILFRSSGTKYIDEGFV